MGYKESEKKIEEIRGRDEMLFRMAVSHLMDVGIRNLTPKNVELACTEMMTEDDSRSLMTNQFKCDLVHVAGLLAEIDHIHLLKYISEEVYYDVGDSGLSYQRVIELLKNCLDWFTDDTDNERIVENLNLLNFRDDEIKTLGFGWLFEEEEDNE